MSLEDPTKNTPSENPSEEMSWTPQSGMPIPTPLKTQLLAHLKNPLKPVEETYPTTNDGSQLAVRKYAAFPLETPQLEGGLLPEVHEWSKTNDAELFEASKKHREKSRIKVSAVLKASYLYAKSATLTLSKKERDALLTGISLKKPKDAEAKYIKITRQKGSGLSEEFKVLIEDLQESINKTKKGEKTEILSLTLSKALQINNLRQALETNQALRKKYQERHSRHGNPSTL
jgi:hypothetical protein